VSQLELKVIKSKNSNKHTIEFDVKFEQPWEISNDQRDKLQLEVCGQHFEPALQKKLNAKVYNKGCLRLQNHISQQIDAFEKEALQVLNIIMSVIIYM